MSALLGPPAAALTALAAIVLLTGVAHAVTRRRAAGGVLAVHAGLALELLLAAGLVRLPAAESFRALALVAGVVVLRQVIARGIRAGVAGPG